jgi:hypothetical protein
MKKRVFYISILLVLSLNAQEKKHSYFDTDCFYGMALEHDKSLETAIQGNPYGKIFGYSIKNTSNANWLKYYNYPEFGFSALYQNTNSSILGEMYGLYTHYNFYLNNRNAKNKFQFRVAFGLGYITNPYNKISNPYNFALATNFAGSGYFKLNYQRDFFKGRLGFQTGLTVIHFSNAAFKNPNLGLNTLAFNLGWNYNFNKTPFVFTDKERTPRNKEKLRYNLLFRTGLNESKNAGSGQYPFYVGTFEIEKKINFKSTLVTGTEFFKSDFLNKYLQQEKEKETGIPDNTNYKTNRIGVFIGHELYINHFSMVTQIGYNVYYPNKYVTRVYERFGFKTHLNNHFFTELTLKLNLFRAEDVEFALGYRF